MQLTSVTLLKNNHNFTIPLLVDLITADQAAVASSIPITVDGQIYLYAGRSLTIESDRLKDGQLFSLNQNFQIIQRVYSSPLVIQSEESTELVTVLYDTFTGNGLLSAHTPEVGEWNVTSGDLDIANGRLILPDDDIVNFDSANPQSVFTAALNFIFPVGGLTANSLLSISFNLNANDNSWWYLRIFNNQLAIGYQALNVNTDYDTFAIGSNDSASSEIIIDTTADDGDTINIYINRNLVMTHTESNRRDKSFGGLYFYSGVSADILCQLNSVFVRSTV